MKCGAKTKAGGTCENPPMPNGRCRMHGGKSLAGKDSATFKTGRYSKYLPERLAARYEEAQNDDDLIMMRDEIALLDARLAELVEGIGKNKPWIMWDMLRNHWVALDKARKEDDGEKILEYVDAIGAIIQSGGDDANSWDEIYTAVGHRKSLVESERKRLVEMQQMITAERAYLLVTSLVDIVREHVSDKSVMAAIASDARRLVSSEV
ncbi:MAG: HGGxSTG domain-containing protein [Chloroflexota bacterium]